MRNERHQREADHEARIRKLAVALHPRLHPREQRLHDEKTHSEIPDTAADVQERMGDVVVEAREHHREQAPRGGIVNCPGADRDGAHRRAGEFFEMDDPGEHRKRRDAHRGTEEQHRLGERSLLREKLRVVKQHPAQRAAEHERREHPRDGNGDRTLQPFPDDVRAKLHPDDEHVERQPELRRREKIALRVACRLRAVPRKKPLLPFRREQSEKGWPKQHTRDHLRDDLGLPEARGDGSDDPAEKQNDRKLQEKVNGELEIVHRQDRGTFGVPSGSARKVPERAQSLKSNLVTAFVRVPYQRNETPLHPPSRGRRRHPHLPGLLFRARGTGSLPGLRCGDAPEMAERPRRQERLVNGSDFPVACGGVRALERFTK
jgi:hypothetical protein